MNYINITIHKPLFYITYLEVVINLVTLLINKFVFVKRSLLLFTVSSYALLLLLFNSNTFLSSVLNLALILFFLIKLTIQISLSSVLNS